MGPDVRLVQRFAANAFSIGVIRRMAPAGTLRCIWGFLGEKLDLSQIGSLTPDDFPLELDEQTKRFMRAMPLGGRRWGMARKCLNLFLRDALYSFYLRGAYNLEKLESVLEIPLDSQVGTALRRHDKSLPQWPGVVNLTPAVSAKFQAAASQIAAEQGTSRVHLDVGYWRASGVSRDPSGARRT